MAKFQFFIFLLFALLNLAHSRFIHSNSSSSSSSSFASPSVSDGIDNFQEQPFMLLDHHELRLTVPVTCEPVYSFLPCTTNPWGLFLTIIVYEYMLFVGEKYISMGTELLFKILGPGIFGASAFHVLGSLPEAILVLVSGIYGSQENAQEQVMTGMSILAGSTVLLLTLLWGSCLVFGMFDLTSSSSIPSTSSSVVQRVKHLSLTGYGVTTDVETSYTARIMLLSMIPMITVLAPRIFSTASTVEHIAILVSQIATVILLFTYCFYQVFQPWIQNRRLAYLSDKYKENIVLGKLLGDDGEPKTDVIKDLFKKIDQNQDKSVSFAELKGLIIGIQFEEVGLQEEDFVEKVMKEFDTSGDAHVDEAEFVRGISKWLSQTKQSVNKRVRRRRENISCSISSQKSELGMLKKAGEEMDNLLDRTGDVIKEIVDNFSGKFFKAIFFLVLGSSILGILAEPLIETVQNFSTAVNLDSFYVSFIILPLAINYRETVAAITTARAKKTRSASLTFSEIYSAVFMNNIIGLSMFLSIIYTRGLVWNFSPEILVVVIICSVMGLSGCFCTTFALWTSLFAYLLYPFSLLLLYVLKFVWASRG